MGFSSLLVTLCLCWVFNMEEVALRAGLWVWVIFLIFFAWVLGWVFFLFVEIMGCYRYFQGEPAAGGAILGYGMELFLILFAVTVALLWWLF